MDSRPPDRLEELLTRAFDGEISPDERRELDALADVEPRLVALAELRDALRAALAVPGPVDVAGEVMAVLAVEDEWTLGGDLWEALSGGVDFADAIFAGIAADAAWAPVGASLKEALRAPEIDVAAAVMGAVDDEAAWKAVAGQVRDAVAAPPVDVADAVFAEIAAEAAWAPVGAALRDAVGVRVDVADAVMADIDPECELSAYLDGELSPERAALVDQRLLDDPAARDRLAALASLGEDLRGATARNADLWVGIADGIGVERDVVHGWDAVAGPLREAFAALPEIDVAGAVMAAVEPAVSRGARAGGRMPLWASLGAPLAVFASAAAVLFAVLLPTSAPQNDTLTTSLRLATINDAQVEEVSAAEDVVVQVMQFEDGGPTFILVDDSSGSGVPL